MKTGDVIEGRFQLEDIIGQGGMGVVFRAKDLSNNNIVALKSLRSVNVNTARRFLREAEVLEGLTHPGIVRYIKHGLSEKEELYLAMEWLEGEDLSRRLRRGALSLDESLSVIHQLAETLSVAHAQGVIHRDIKPQNIFLCGASTKNVKLLDFGIARLGGAFSDVTATGVVMGTPGYLAPEQATRGAKGLEASADIFSLGCVFYECLSGKMPFIGDNVLSVLSKILLADTPKIRQVRPEVPEVVESLIIETLEKEPNARPKDGAAFLRRLELLSVTTQPTVEMTRPRAITEGEQRLLCVLLLGQAQATSSATVREPLHDAPTAEYNAFNTLRSEAEDFGGRLDAFIDGSVVVTFSKVGSATDLAAQAARCALSLASKLSGRIALATGRGDLSQTLPVGEVIERALLLQKSYEKEAAKPEGAEVWIDESTAGLLHNRFALTGGSYGFRLHQERDLAEPVRTLLGKALPCIGRERELASLEAMARECIDDETLKIALVTAPAGVGKSRVRQEFLLNLTKSSLSFERLLCRAEPLRINSSLSLLGNALRNTAGIHENEAPALQQKKMRARVSRNVLSPEVTQVSDFLGALAGLPPVEEPSELFKAARREPQVMAAQLQRHLEEFLQAELRAYPVLLLLEDLHWADAATIQMLDAVMRSLNERPLFVFALARPEVRTTFPELWSNHDVSEFGLSALSKKNAERFVKQALPALTQERSQQLVELSQGNAFYLEELCRSAAESQGKLPETLVAMTSARLEQLSSEERKILRAASVFGEGFWSGGVRALVGESSRESLTEKLRSLQTKEFINRRPESRMEGEDELAFRHALLREAAYAMFTDDDKKLAHQLAAEWLAAGRERDPLVIAKHFELGGVKSKALEYYLQAARHARGAASPEALALFEEALALGAEGAQRGELLTYLAEVYLWRSDYERLFLCGEEALQLLPEDSLDRYRALSWLLGAKILMAPEEAIKQVRALSQEPFAGGERGQVQIIAWANVAMQVAIGGFVEEARHLLQRVMENEEPVRGDRFMMAQILLSKAMVPFLFEADPWEMRRLCSEAEGHFRSFGGEMMAGFCQMHKYLAELFLGDFEGGLARLEAFYPTVQATMGEGAYFVKMLQLVALYWLGRHDEVCTIAEEIAPIAAKLNPFLDEPGIYALHARSLLAKGEVHRAEALATKALMVPLLVRILAVNALAEIKLALGKIEEALALIQEQEQRLLEVNIVTFFGFTSPSSSIKVFDAAGLHQESREKLTSLVALIKDRAARIEDPRYRDLFLQSPDNQYLLGLARERLERVS